MSGEEVEEGIEERRFTCKVFESELRSLREHRIKVRRDSNVEELQAVKSPDYAQYLRYVEFLLKTRSIEGDRQRGYEADIADRIL